VATKKAPELPSLFSPKKTAAPVVLEKAEPDYDAIVPGRIPTASDAALRALITWADYCYWVKNSPIMKDTTFDMLVRAYEARRPDDRAFLDRLGMWGST
jgi:hypothetical protein